MLKSAISPTVCHLLLIQSPGKFGHRLDAQLDFVVDPLRALFGGAGGGGRKIRMKGAHQQQGKVNEQNYCNMDECTQK